MRKILLYFLLVIPLIIFPVTAYAAEGVVILCYHDVGPDGKNSWAVSKETLLNHLNYLKQNGYNPITLEQYADACEGSGTLPSKPVLLTFDDGYRSFYNDVFPLLKKFRYPAVLSVVAAWQIGYKPPDVGPLVSWQQMREMEDSGLVSVAAHSNNLHRYLPLATQARRPAARPARYGEGRYEPLEDYRDRITADMQMARLVLEKGLGHPVSAYTWPYGEYTMVALECGKAAGFKTFFTLESGLNIPGTGSLDQAKRVAVSGATGNAELARLLNSSGIGNGPLRMAQLDLDIIFDTDSRQFERNIDEAIDYLRRSRANTIFLEAHADDAGTGDIESVYFYTKHAPVKKDVFNHVVERLQAADFRVYAWLSTMAGQWLIKGHAEDEVQAVEPKEKGWYRRATPFSPRVREALKNLAGDLAAYSTIDGVIFNDDLYFNDYEDFSPAAKAVFKARFNQELTQDILKNPEIMREWTDIKTKSLNNLTLELMAEIRKYRPNAAAARNIYSAAILEADAKEWLAQDFYDYLQLYDYTVIMAYPRMEKAQDGEAWLKVLTQQALGQAMARDKVIFKLQAIDWDTDKWLRSRELGRQVKVLRDNGAVHLGYYPVNALDDRAEPLPY